MRRLLLPLFLVASMCVVSVAAANTSHEGWPPINGQLIMHKLDQNGSITPFTTNLHNELLGGHGNDVITAGNVGDVLWGDYKPSGQPTTQNDVLQGGAGRDFIYAGHGRNSIDTGAGNDVVHAHFGYGSITCHSPDTIVFLSHKSRPGYRLSGCRHISYKTHGH
jgi:hypothetical protein